MSQTFEIGEHPGNAIGYKVTIQTWRTNVGQEGTASWFDGKFYHYVLLDLDTSGQRPDSGSVGIFAAKNHERRKLDSNKRRPAASLTPEQEHCLLLFFCTTIGIDPKGIVLNRQRKSPSH